MQLGGADPTAERRTDRDRCVEAASGAVAEAGDLAGDLVERLMGKKPELRFQYIQENARFVEELDV